MKISTKLYILSKKVLKYLDCENDYVEKIAF